MKKLLLLFLLIPTLVWATPPSRIYTYTSGNSINPDEVTANEDAIFNYLNRDTEAVADNSITTTKILDGTIINADISSSAGIVYSKLTFADNIVAGDIGINAVGSSELASTTVSANSYTNTDLTVDADGRITSASSGTVALGSEVSGTLSIANGGTGSTSTTYCTLTTNVAGTLPVTNGGTGTTTLTDGGILLGSGTGAVTALGVATNGQIPIGDGTTNPVLATITGTADEVDVSNGAGSITIGLVNPLATSKGGTGATAAANAANGVVVLNASSQLPAVSGALLTNISVTKSQLFTSTDTFTAPAGVSMVYVTLCGGGGGGGGGGSGNGGGGGGSGAYAIKVPIPVTASSNYTATVGTGGSTGGNGNNSSFTGDSSLVVTANGGTAGDAGASGGNGGAGGTASTGTTIMTLVGRAGAARSGTAGGNGAGSMAGIGGAGSADGVVGVVGTGYGSGGGGGGNNANGGAGKAGFVLIEY